MNQKVHKTKENKPKPAKWDKYSIIFTIIIFFFLFIIASSQYIKWSDLKEIFNNDKYEYTSAKILNVDNIQVPEQTRTGSYFSTTYFIEYEYIVFGKKYNKKEKTSLNPNNVNNILVKYNIKDPEESYLEFE